MSDRLCETCGDYKELCGHDFLYAEIKRLKAENQRLRDTLRDLWYNYGGSYKAKKIKALLGGGGDE